MNNSPALAKQLSKIINLLFVFQAFLIPIFFLPITYEFYEFNKLHLFTAFTAINTILWAAKMLSERKVLITKSSLDIPLIILTASFLLSTLASLSKNSSIYGSYSRWFPSLSAIVVLVFYYYNLASNLSDVKVLRKVLFGFTASSAISSIWALANYFGLNLSKNGFYSVTGFNTMGIPTSAAMVYSIGGIIAFSFLFASSKSHAKVAWASLALANLSGAIIIGGASSFIPLIVGLILTLAATSLKEKGAIIGSKLLLIPTSLFLVGLVIALYLVPQTRDILKNPRYPTETNLSNRESWIIASTTLRDFPILGSGVSTFYLDYPRYRSLNQNSQETWTVRFDKPANQVYEIAATLGLVGLIAYALFFRGTLKMTLAGFTRSQENDLLPVILGSATVATTVSMFTSYQNFTGAFMQFSLLGLLAAYGHISGNKHVSKKVNLAMGSGSQATELQLTDAKIIETTEIIHYVVAVPMVILSLLSVYLGIRQYIPEYLLRKSVTVAQTDLNKAYELQSRAVNMNLRRSEYQRIYTNTNLTLAQIIASKEGITDQDKATAQNLLAQAIRSSKYASEVSEPLNAANWETRAIVYRYLIPVAKDSESFSIQAYNTAIQLDPTNPALRLALGGIYFQKQDYLTAGNYYRQAVNLKPDYANARYNLGHALWKLNALDNAKTEFELTMQLLKEDTDDYNKVAADLEELKATANTPAATDPNSKPSVEELNLKTQQPTTNQKPLTGPGEPVQPSTETLEVNQNTEPAKNNE